jgi:hypothetical protein
MQEYPGPFAKKKWTRQERDQIKSFSKDLVRKLLDKDDRWEFIGVNGGRATYRNPEHDEPYTYVAVHTSTERFQNPSLLFWMIDHICWTPKDLRKWKAIK